MPNLATEHSASPSMLAQQISYADSSILQQSIFYEANFYCQTFCLQDRKCFLVEATDSSLVDLEQVVFHYDTYQLISASISTRSFLCFEYMHLNFNSTTGGETSFYFSKSMDH